MDTFSLFFFHFKYAFTMHTKKIAYLQKHDIN